MRHSAPIPVQASDPNGAVNTSELRGVIDALRQEVRQLSLRPPVVHQIATPPDDQVSACAGIRSPSTSLLRGTEILLSYI